MYTAFNTHHFPQIELFISSNAIERERESAASAISLNIYDVHVHHISLKFHSFLMIIYSIVIIGFIVQNLFQFCRINNQFVCLPSFFSISFRVCVCVFHSFERMLHLGWWCYREHRSENNYSIGNQTYTDAINVCSC